MFLLMCDELVDFGSVPSDSSTEDSWVKALGLGYPKVFRFPSLILGFNLFVTLSFLAEEDDVSISSSSTLEFFLFLVVAFDLWDS